MVWLVLLFGLILLTAGGESLVRGSSSLALRLGISPLVIGLTVVALGTSAPEAVVSIIATVNGSPDIAVGNVVGSNIFNVLLILGTCALLSPLVVAQALVRRDVPIMIGASLLVWLFAVDSRISFVEGAVLLAGLTAFVVYTLRASRRETANVEAEYDAATKPPLRGSWMLDVLFVGGGLVLLVLGARYLVDSAVQIASGFGVDDAIIGLTIVAAGTSLPEVATSVIATIRGQRDIAVGNVVGSNIFNILGVLGVAAVSSGGRLGVAPSIQNFDLPMMVAVAIACSPIFFTGARISRWEGFLFLGYYVAYTAYLILNTTGHAMLPIYSIVMLQFIAPLTVVTLAIGVYRAVAEKRVPAS